MLASVSRLWQVRTVDRGRGGECRSRASCTVQGQLAGRGRRGGARVSMAVERLGYSDEWCRQVSVPTRVGGYGGGFTA